MAHDQVRVNQDSLRAAGEGAYIPMKGTKRGEMCVVDFLLEMAIEGRGYQVRAGNLTTAITGGVTAADTESEMAVNALSNMTVMPVEAMVSIDVAAGDAIEIHGKSVAGATSAGTAFAPLPLLMGGIPSRCTAVTKTAGGCTVPAETVTTTIRHFCTRTEFANTDGTDPHLPTNPTIWQPLAPPVIVGAGVFYVQIGSATTAPNYYAHFDYLEFETTQIN